MSDLNWNNGKIFLDNNYSNEIIFIETKVDKVNMSPTIVNLYFSGESYIDSRLFSKISLKFDALMQIQTKDLENQLKDSNKIQFDTIKFDLNNNKFSCNSETWDKIIRFYSEGKDKYREFYDLDSDEIQELLDKFSNILIPNHYGFEFYNN